ncbi:hypothetical protein EV06_0158 [Prochlorococcus sp. MIT 0602]|nr:hypothetical protein EV06_0158 [Prochlorococcus sp. MIT 0602]
MKSSVVILSRRVKDWINKNRLKILVEIPVHRGKGVNKIKSPRIAIKTGNLYIGVSITSSDLSIFEKFICINQIIL